MDRTDAILVGLFGVIGAIAFLALFVYPMNYGPVESAAVWGLIVLTGFWEFVLDSADLGESE